MCIEIPSNLDELRFINLHQDNPTKQKHPYGNAWTKNHFSHSEQTQRLNGDKSYGVMCGQSNLIVVDCDRKELQDVILQNSMLSNTFTVKTAGKGLYHFYFQIDPDQPFPENPSYPGQPRGYKLDNVKGDRIGDVQGSGTQVVGPNSKMIDGRRYEIVKDVPIVKVPYDYLRNLLLNTDIGIHIIEKESKIKNHSISDELLELSDPQTAAIKSKVKISDLLPKKLLKLYQESPSGHTGCPFHTSESNSCFHITDNKVFHCFHCGRGGDVISLQQYLNGDDNFIKAKFDLMKKIGLITELKAQVITALASKKQKDKNKAFEMMANEFIKLYNVKTVRSDISPEVWIYDKGIYVPNGKTYIRTFIYENIGALSNQQFDNRVIDLIMKKTWIEYDDFFRTTYPAKIPVMNGILNTDTQSLEIFSPNYFFFNKLPVSFDPTVGLPKTFMKFLNEILSTQSDRDAIQEMFGYCLYRDYKWQKAFLLEGNGSNGKSVLCRILETMLGKYNVSNLTLQSLETEKFMLHNLMNKLANIDADLPNKTLELTNRFKAATGEDPLDIDRKFKEPVKFRNYAKMIFGCNNVPKTKDTSEGFMRRWMIIRFPFEFVDKPINPNQKLRDINIVKSLTTDKEMNSILNWSLIGLKRLFENNNFTHNQGTTDIRNFWKRKSSIVAAFIDDNLTEEAGEMILKSTFLKELKEYAQNERLPIWRQISNELEEQGIFIERKTVNYLKSQYLIDINFKDPSKNIKNPNTEGKLILDDPVFNEETKSK